MEKGPSTKEGWPLGWQIYRERQQEVRLRYDPLGDHSVFSKALKSSLRSRAEGKDIQGVILRERILDGCSTIASLLAGARSFRRIIR